MGSRRPVGSRDESRSARTCFSRSALRRSSRQRAALLAVANAPGAFHPAVRQIGGVPYPAMYQVLEEVPRYLHWLACQGLFGTIHPWWAIVAADLELRIAWRRLQPGRGSGRLLWACEQMATPAHAAQAVPRWWRAARARGHASPDWPGTARRPDAGWPRTPACKIKTKVPNGPWRLPQAAKGYD